MRSVSCSAAGLAAKRTPAPGQAAGAVDLPGVLATASRVRVRVIGTLALQCLAELALVLILGTIRLRRGVSHADLLPGRRYPQLRTCESGMPPGRVAGGDRRRVLPHQARGLRGWRGSLSCIVGHASAGQPGGVTAVSVHSGRASRLV